MVRDNYDLLESTFGLRYSGRLHGVDDGWTEFTKLECSRSTHGNWQEHLTTLSASPQLTVLRLSSQLRC